MPAHKHAADTPALATVLRVRPVTVTRRPHERRAMSSAELRRLLDAAEAGPAREGIPGPMRALLYRVAAETGLRAGELRRLRRRDLHLADPDAATLTVRAESSKNRKTATLPLPLPLRPGLAADPLAATAGKMPAALALAVPGRQHTARTLAADLADARAAWLAEAGGVGDDAAGRVERESSDFPNRRDHAGRVLDFHGLRHTFVSNPSAAGVPVKVAQTPARHGDARLTPG